MPNVSQGFETTQVIHVDHETVQATALKVVFDLLHVYGFETFNAVPPTNGDDGGARGGEVS